MLKRLLHEVEGAGAQALDGQIQRRVAGGHDDLGVRHSRARRPQHVDAAGAWHPHVGDDHVELGFGQAGQRRQAIGGGRDAIALLAQFVGHHGCGRKSGSSSTSRIFASALTKRLRWRRGRSGPVRTPDGPRPVAGPRAGARGRHERQPNPASWYRFLRPCAHLDRAAMRLDGLPAERQPDSRALADRLGGEEGIEDPWQHVGGDAGSGIDHADLQSGAAAVGVGRRGQRHRGLRWASHRWRWTPGSSVRIRCPGGGWIKAGRGPRGVQRSAICLRRA